MMYKEATNQKLYNMKGEVVYNYFSAQCVWRKMEENVVLSHFDRIQILTV